MHGIIFSLKASFSARRKLQFLKKVSQNRTKNCNNKQTNKQTNHNKRPFFLPKINKVLLRPILQNLKGRSVLENFSLKMILPTSRIRCYQAKNSIFLGSRSKTQNSGQNRIYPSLTLLTAKFFPLRGGGQTFFRAFINSELGPPEMAPCMAQTFGGVSGLRRRTGSEPLPAQIWSQK